VGGGTCSETIPVWYPSFASGTTIVKGLFPCETAVAQAQFCQESSLPCDCSGNERIGPLSDQRQDGDDVVLDEIAVTNLLYRNHVVENIS